MIKATFTFSPYDVAKDTEVFIEGQIMETTRRIFKSVVEKSPVRTGSFRASWDIFTTEEFTDVVGGSPVAPLPPPSVPPMQRRSTYYITNGKEYAQRLEDGWSRQAPAGFVRLTLAELDAGVL